MATFITGKKVILRTLNRKDLSTLTEWMNDPEITQYTNAYHPMMFEFEEQWYEKLSGNTNNFVLALETKDEQGFIGVMGIHRIDHRNQTAATSAIIGDKSCHGKGYGTDAKMHLLHWAFQELNLRKVNSTVLATNPRSQRYLEKTGYKKVGIRRENHLLHGTFVDEILMEVFRDDFMRVWGAYKETA